MSLRVIGELEHNIDELIRGLADKIISEKELLFAPGNIKRINISTVGLHRIILEFLYGAGPADDANRPFSLHFANAGRRVVWTGKSKKPMGAVIINSFSRQINPAFAEKGLHNTKKVSFTLLSIKQAEEKIICLINNYLMAL